MIVLTVAGLVIRMEVSRKTLEHAAERQDKQIADLMRSLHDPAHGFAVLAAKIEAMSSRQDREYGAMTARVREITDTVREIDKRLK